MSALLPLVCVALAARLFRSGGSPANASLGRRDALLAGAVSAGLFATTVAELSSLAWRFDRAVVLGAWLLLSIVLAASVWRRRRESAAPPVTRPLDQASRREIALLFGLGLLAAAVTLTAAAAAPNNWDSMTYHLPRIAHWLQDAAVFHYPSHVLRQLTLGPGAEMLTAQLELLAGSDRGINFIQTFAWLGVAIAASVLAKDLGAGRPGQTLAAVFTATLPMAILQASSTQNDLVLSLWLLVFVHFALRALSEKTDMTGWLVAGGSLGLAVLTKPTALIVSFPFGIALVVGAVARGRAGARRGLAAAMLLALAVNVGHVTRNLALFGSPLGGEHGAVNSAFLPDLALSNLGRNMALQLLAPWPSWNACVEAAILALHRALGLSASDPRSTWRGAEFHLPARMTGALPSDAEESVYAAFNEDEAGNPIHFLISAVCALVLVARRDLPGNRRLWSFIALVVAGFFLFSLVLKWQPWGARLELPFLFLAAPFTGAVLSEGRAAAPVTLALLLCSAPWALLNATRPLLGPDSVLTTPRLVQSFIARPGLREPLLSAARAVAAKRCQRIGLEIGSDDPEHLIRLSLREAGLSDARIEHVHVTNRSALKAAKAPFAGFAPCAVITLAPPGPFPASGQVSAKDWDASRVSVRAGP